MDAAHADVPVEGAPSDAAAPSVSSAVNVGADASAAVADVVMEATADTAPSDGLAAASDESASVAASATGHARPSEEAVPSREMAHSFLKQVRCPVPRPPLTDAVLPFAQRSRASVAARQGDKGIR